MNTVGRHDPWACQVGQPSLAGSVLRRYRARSLREAGPATSRRILERARAPDCSRQRTRLGGRTIIRAGGPGQRDWPRAVTGSLAQSQ